MKVTIAALLGVRRLLGWGQKELNFAGGTVADLLKQIEVPGKGNLCTVLVQDDGNLNPRYRFALNQQIIDRQAMQTQIKEGDRLVVMDAIHVPSLTC
jgi:sulfur carrier protein ThiS